MNKFSSLGIASLGIALAITGYLFWTIDDDLDAEQNAPQKVAASPVDISPLLESIAQNTDVPGIAAALIHADGIESIGAAGIRTATKPARVAINDAFHIGSCTKSMTATLCAMLVEEGKISWNTKVIDLFPELSSTMNPAFEPLTLELLLYHRGGMQAPTHIDGWVLQEQTKDNVILARQIIMEGALAMEPSVPLGTFEYSNIGYVIAGHMAEKATGKSWETLMREKLFTPLGMTTAGFGNPAKRDSNLQPSGHSEENIPHYDDNPAWLGPAGTVHCSIGDWVKYVRSHLQGAEGIEGKPRLLSLASFKKLQSPLDDPKYPPSDYAMGWGVNKEEWAGGRNIWHNGSNGAWYAIVWMAPDRNFSILFLSNKDSTSGFSASGKVFDTLLSTQD